MKKRGQAEIIGALFFIIILVMAFATFYYMYYDFSNFAYLENQKIQQEHIAQAQILVENYSVQAQNVQFNVSSTNSLGSSPYLYKLDGIAPVTLNVSTAQINITVPIKAKSYVLDLYGYSRNLNATNLFVYAKNSTGDYVLIEGYVLPPGPFQLNIPLSSGFIVNGLVQLKLNASQIANYAAGSVVNAENYIILTIFNMQNSPTPAPFQQMINLTSTNQIAQLVNPNGSNVAFEYLNGSLIPSWFQGKDSHGDFIWWIKLQNGIPADSWLTIKMMIGAWNTNFYRLYTGKVGEAPQLSPIYGEYDNGQNVFIFYDNFTSLNSSKWKEGGNGNIIVNHGLTITCYSGQVAYLYSTNNFGDDYSVEALGNIIITSSSSGQQETFGLGYPGSNSYIIFSSTSPGNNKVTLEANKTTIPKYSPGKYDWLLELINNNIYGFQNYSNENEITDSQLSSFSQPIYFYCYNPKTSASSSLTLGPFYWVLVRASPPNGYMPKVLFGYILTTLIGTKYIQSTMKNFIFSKIAVTASLSLPLTNYTTYYPNATDFYLINWQGTSATFIYKNILPASKNMSLCIDIYNPNTSSSDTVNISFSGITKTYNFKPEQEERIYINIPTSVAINGSLDVKVVASQNTIIREAILQAIVPHVIVVNVGSYPITIIRIWDNSNPPKYFSVSITLMPGEQVDLSNYFVQGSNIIKVVTSDGNYYSFYY
jgi:hypothetical protein